MEAKLWPLVFARLSASVLVLVDRRAERATCGRRPARRCGWRVLAALLDTGANVAMLLALQASLLSLAGVLMSLYPAATVLLAIVVLRERVTRWQAVGMVLALVAGRDDRRRLAATRFPRACAVCRRHAVAGRHFAHARAPASATFGRVTSPSRPVTNLDKSDVLAGLFAVWDDIDALLAGLADAQWHAPTPLPGWTVHDVTAHLIGTESMLQGVATPDADIDVSTLKHVRNDIGVMNERWVRKLRGVSPTRAAREVPRDDRRTAQGA